MLLICNNLLFSILYDVIFLGELYFDLKFSAPIFSFSCSNILVFLFNFGGCGNERKLSSVDEEEDNIF